MNPCSQASGIICVRVSNSSLKQKKISILKKTKKSIDLPGKTTEFFGISVKQDPPAPN